MGKTQYRSVGPPHESKRDAEAWIKSPENRLYRREDGYDLKVMKVRDHWAVVYRTSGAGFR